MVMTRMWQAIKNWSEALGNMTTQPQMFIVNVFLLLAFISMVLFGLLLIFVENNPQLGYLEIAGGCAVALDALGLIVTRNVRLARILLLCIMLGFLMLMLATGGTQGTGIFWFFVFPVSAFLLAGKRGGIFWMTLLFGSTLLFLLLANSGWVTIFYDPITIRQLLVSMCVMAIGVYAYQQAREKTEERIRQEHLTLDRAKNEFLALVSHQLRTPISAIAWYGEMLLHGDAGKLGDTQREYVTQMYDSNQRSAAIVDDIITIFDFEVRRVEMHFETIDLSKLCRHIIRKVSSQHAKKLKITQHYATEQSKIRGDAALMRMIVQNLLSNAIKYTPAGGTIDLAVDHTTEILNPKSHGSTRIVISDTGYGIPKNEQPRIFTKLFRGSNIKIKDTDGTGLGLYIAKTILDRIGGKISFESELNKGSVFTVLLPAEGMRYWQTAGRVHV